RLSARFLRAVRLPARVQALDRRDAGGVADAVRLALVQHTRYREAERADAGVELLAAGLHDHVEIAVHGANRRVERAAAGVLEFLAGLQHRLVADDARATHLLDLAVAGGDDPVPRQ